MTHITVSIRASDTELAMRRRWLKVCSSFFQPAMDDGVLSLDGSSKFLLVVSGFIFVTLSSQGGSCAAVQYMSNTDQIQNLFVVPPLRTVECHLSQNTFSLSQDARISEDFTHSSRATLLIVTLRDDFLPAQISAKSIIGSWKIKLWVRKTSTLHLVYHAR